MRIKLIALGCALGLAISLLFGFSGQGQGLLDRTSRLEERVEHLEQFRVSSEALASELQRQILRINGIQLECHETDWGQWTDCTEWPEATPPGCGAGYSFVGISRVTQGDGGCGISAKNNQRVKAMCCRVAVPATASQQ